MAFFGDVVAVLSACIQDSFSDSSQLNNSSATTKGREDKFRWVSHSGPANWSSHPIQYSLKTSHKYRHVSSCLFFVCKSSLKRDYQISTVNRHFISVLFFFFWKSSCELIHNQIKIRIVFVPLRCVLSGNTHHTQTTSHPKPWLGQCKTAGLEGTKIRSCLNRRR